MPYADNQGVRIHYEVEGNGPGLVLLHGLGSDLESWRDSGYVERLKKDYQLILIDARGHGLSDKPHDPEAYKLRILVNDVVGTLDDLGVDKAHFMGYSMGGWIGFGIAEYVCERFQSLIIGGANPYVKPGEPNLLLESLIKVQKMTEPARSEFLSAWYEKTLGPRLTPQLRVKLMANDLEAQIALTSTEDWMRSLECVLPTISIPCLFFVGEADPNYFDAKRCADSIPRATFISFPNLGHIETRYRSDLVLPYIIRFLGRVDKNRNTAHY